MISFHPIGNNWQVTECRFFRIYDVIFTEFVPSAEVGVTQTTKQIVGDGNFFVMSISLFLELRIMMTLFELSYSSTCLKIDILLLGCFWSIIWTFLLNSSVCKLVGKWNWNSFYDPSTQNRHLHILKHSQWLASPFKETVTTRITMSQLSENHFEVVLSTLRLKNNGMNNKSGTVESLMKNSIQRELLRQINKANVVKTKKPKSSAFWNVRSKT